jgi:hypothetical protein
MLSSISKDPKAAETYKFPELHKPVQNEVRVPDVPGAEGFTRFNPAQNLEKEVPKPVVQPAIFENLKPIQP